MSIFNNSYEMLQAGHETATAAADRAAKDYIDEKLGGQDHYPCGFAWVSYYPEHKGNTRLGREERRMVEQIGFRKDVYGKKWDLWNPSKNHCQNVDAKYTGALEYAKILDAVCGIRVSPGERLD